MSLTRCVALCLTLVIAACDEEATLSSEGSETEQSERAERPTGSLSEDSAEAWVDDISVANDVGCDWTFSAPELGPEAPPLVADENAPTGSVAGRLIAPDGQGISGLRMLACTPSICYWDETDGEGRFLVSDLALGPLKMQTGDPSATRLELIFYHWLDDEGTSELAEAVTVPLLPADDPVPWSEAGGSVLLAGGQLELIAEPESITYPFGTKEESVRARRVPGSQLPHYDWTPWAGEEADTFAFVINPTGIEVEPVASLRVIDDTLAPCDAYRIWSVASKDGRVTYAGIATVEEREGTLVLESIEGAALNELTTLIFSPVVD